MDTVFQSSQWVLPVVEEGQTGLFGAWFAQSVKTTFSEERPRLFENLAVSVLENRETWTYTPLEKVA